MADSGSGAMGEQQQQPCVVGMEEQCRDIAGALYGKRERNTLLHSGNLSRPPVSQRVLSGNASRCGRVSDTVATHETESLHGLLAIRLQWPGCAAAKSI